MKTRAILVVIGSIALMRLSGFAMTPSELAIARATGEKMTVVDVRSNEAYRKSHIPGAINIPASLCPLKRLPPLGLVVVYADGIGEERIAEKAAEALNQNIGIRAEVLEGGFTAWRNHQNQVVATRGLSPEEFPTITYQELKAASQEDLVLVDLRARDGASQMKGADTGEPLTDLRAEFPRARIVRSPFAAVRLAGTDRQGGAVLVLIDRGGGVAERTARLLKAQGIHRFAILVGGETILARKGRPGLERSGAVISVPVTDAVKLPQHQENK